MKDIVRWEIKDRIGDEDRAIYERMSQENRPELWIFTSSRHSSKEQAGLINCSHLHARHMYSVSLPRRPRRRR